LLAVYNLAFLVPVLLVMIAAWRGTTSLTLAEWSRRNAVWGKVLLGLFFLALGIVLLVT
jgi:cytochrome c biogenesis protein CcdA